MKILETACVPASADDDFLAMQERVCGTNVNETTMIATDYLNHFNEVVMMLDMVHDIPVFLDELRKWEPKSYIQHFRDATFSEAALAIEAYAHVPEKFRKPFEKAVELMDQAVDSSVIRLSETVDANNDKPRQPWPRTIRHG